MCEERIPNEDQISREQIAELCARQRQDLGISSKPLHQQVKELTDLVCSQRAALSELDAEVHEIKVNHKTFANLIHYEIFPE